MALTSPKYTIQKADFSSAALISLLETHHATVTDPDSNIPGQQTYALNLDDLQRADIQLWTISTQSMPSNSARQLLGFGALKSFTSSDGSVSGEIKSMHTVSSARRGGVGAAMIAKLVDEAMLQHMKTLYLETGSSPAFERARKFYEANGFVECGPFGKYETQENSVFMRKELEQT